MENELWEKSQMLVDADMGHLVKHLYIKEIEANLNAEQLNKLGDLSSFLDQAFRAKSNMKQLIEAITELSKQGAILGPKSDR